MRWDGRACLLAVALQLSKPSAGVPRKLASVYSRLISHPLGLPSTDTYARIHPSTHPPNLPLQGELVDEMHRTGVVESTEFTEQGTEVRGRVPAPLAMRLHPLRLEAAAAALAGGQREP